MTSAFCSSTSLVLLLLLLAGVLGQQQQQQQQQQLSSSSKDIVDEEDDLSAPWFGAVPAKKKYAVHRKGWDKCLLCGGSERLGAIVDVGNLTQWLMASSNDDDDDDSNNTTTEQVVDEILDAVRAHGMIVLKHQNLTRSEQVALTSRLGETVVLPRSFEGNDPEPDQPAVQRITNFWSNDTWKGPTNSFGGYWHQDGQFWVEPRHNLLSILHAQRVPPIGGETGFADLRAARATLSGPLLERSRGASIRASVGDIKDFREGDPNDLALFPDAVHDVLSRHALDNGPILYLGSPHMRVEGMDERDEPETDEPAAAAATATTTTTPGNAATNGKRHLRMLLDHATSPSFTYFHAWDAGDVIIWDNTQTLHHAMPYDNDGVHRREFFRTQARFFVPDAASRTEGGRNDRDEL